MKSAQLTNQIWSVPMTLYTVDLHYGRQTRIALYIYQHLASVHLWWTRNIGWAEWWGLSTLCVSRERGRVAAWLHLLLAAHPQQTKRARGWGRTQGRQYPTPSNGSLGSFCLNYARFITLAGEREKIHTRTVRGRKKSKWTPWLHACVRCNLVPLSFILFPPRLSPPPTTFNLPFSPFLSQSLTRYPPPLLSFFRVLFFF